MKKHWILQEESFAVWTVCGLSWAKGEVSNAHPHCVYTWRAVTCKNCLVRKGRRYT